MKPQASRFTFPLRFGFLSQAANLSASIDHATDHMIQRVIRQEFRDRTLIAITHRPETVEDFDVILVVDDGRITPLTRP
jgi:ATP-binding cassette subfamily C (CFTR/MRP) protein 1